MIKEENKNAVAEEGKKIVKILFTSIATTSSDAIRTKPTETAETEEGDATAFPLSRP